jgi:hypothetical protein
MSVFNTLQFGDRIENCRIIPKRGFRWFPQGNPVVRAAFVVTVVVVIIIIIIIIINLKNLRPILQISR